ncbi:MAG: hypothetical protein HY746_09270 [Elusimicrobia bacterium]|nr:hypothetical protein [Elusimicrobiota bacterium]
MSPKGKGVIQYTYQFVFKDGRSYNFTLNLSYPELQQIKPARAESEKSEWTKLEFQRCKNCTLDAKAHKYCPAAESLQEILEIFKDILSIEEVEVVVKSQERTTTKTLAVQRALGSLIGMYFATSGCPVLNKFAPLARFHLPFATMEETIYRSVGNYLLAQYFIAKEGGKPDWELKGLKEFYKEVEKVNKSLCWRLGALSKKDANLNAVVTLDVFAKNLTELFDRSMEEIKPLFNVYLKSSGL